MIAISNFDVDITKCLTCDEDFKHSKLYWGINDDLSIIKFTEHCKDCRKIIRRKTKLLKDLQECDNQLMEKKYILKE